MHCPNVLKIIKNDDKYYHQTTLVNPKLGEKYSAYNDIPTFCHWIINRKDKLAQSVDFTGGTVQSSVLLVRVVACYSILILANGWR